MNKKELRIKYLDIRKKIKNKDIKSNKIFKKIIKDNDYLNSNVIAIYNNLDDEVRTNKRKKGLSSYSRRKYYEILFN